MKRDRDLSGFKLCSASLQPCSIAAPEMSELPMRKTVIRENDWKQLEIANCELALCLERLRKGRASGNRREIERAETA